MTATEFKSATNLALNHSEIDLTNEEISHFDGFGLSDFKPVFCTIAQLARLIRWQCEYLGGGYDMEELNNIASLGKRRFNIIDEN